MVLVFSLADMINHIDCFMRVEAGLHLEVCLLYTSDAADDHCPV